MGYCHNLTNSTPTALYPAGSAYDFSFENATDPASWANPADVEFVFTSCDAINCWIEPRCTVESVDGKIVKLQQGDNSSCFHRLYYYAQCFNNGQGAGRSLTCKGSQCRGRNPTSIENVRSLASERNSLWTTASDSLPLAPGGLERERQFAGPLLLRQSRGHDQLHPARGRDRSHARRHGHHRNAAGASILMLLSIHLRQRSGERQRSLTPAIFLSQKHHSFRSFSRSPARRTCDGRGCTSSTPPGSGRAGRRAMSTRSPAVSC